MRGGERESEVARGEEHSSGGSVTRHALTRRDVDQALAQGADDPPPAEVGARRDCRGRGHLDPDRHGIRAVPVAARDEGEGHHAHGLLRVIGAVRDGDERGTADLTPAEVALLQLVHHGIRDLVHQPAADHRHQQGDEWREQGGQQDLADHTVELGAVAGPLHPTQAQTRGAGSGEPAEQCVRGAGGQAEQPGEQVPQDATDQTRQHDEEQTLTAVGEELRARRTGGVLQVDHRVGHGERDLHGQERAHEVQHGREADCDLGLQRPGRDRRSHRVRRVVKAVGEVEGQCRHDHEHEDEGCCVHDAQVWG